MGTTTLQRDSTKLYFFFKNFFAEKMENMQVKIILHRGPNESELPRKEIRRFEIEESAIGSYEYFRQKIVTLYPDLTNESPFRLMWTDDEGDNVCFSSDEELSQAIKFINSQENKLFKCIVKFPQPQNAPASSGGGSAPAAAATPKPPAGSAPEVATGSGPNPFFWGGNQNCHQKKMERFQNKMMKNMAKMQNLQKTVAQGVPGVAPGSAPGADFMKHMQQHLAQMNGTVSKCTVDQSNGDVEMHVDIPIRHSDGTSTCSGTTTVTTTVDKGGNRSTTSSSSGGDNNVYPDLNEQAHSSAMNNDFEDLSQEANEAKMNEAIAKMAELGFTGNWVTELLKNVNGDVAKAVEAMNPSK